MTYQETTAKALHLSLKRVHSPRIDCHSPSSIYDVDLSRHSSDKVNLSNAESCAMHESQDGMRTLRPTSDSVDINEALAQTVDSSQWLENEEEPRVKRRKTEAQHDAPADIDSDYLPTDSEEEEEKGLHETFKPTLSRGGGSDADNCAAGVAMVSAADVDCVSQLPRRRNRRTLHIEYWSRTDECKLRKWDHLDEIRTIYECAEEQIFATILKGRNAFLEPNMFPYDTPAGIEHWTLWHVQDLDHKQVKQYVESWIDANAPLVKRWNYDDNPERSINIFHVHVYFQVAKGSTVLQGRKVEDLAHDMN
ncbi:hypothetical protein CCR75_000931 [Bremia lactucae]|uniref:Uncharacterized protein n=1 Tax=Bremia lactucae TaxID=4779 RepID=A0A976FL24_BRELC|nr:hypothetical protein CCR75_000931 [Bremia lactucae]